MGLWNKITSIFGKDKKEENMQEERKTIKPEMQWIPAETVVAKPKNTNKKFVTYSCRKYLGSKKNYKKVERAGYKTLSKSPNFTNNILSYRICLKNNLPIQVLKTANNFPLRFPSIIDLINVMGYKK